MKENSFFLWGAATSSHQVEGHNDKNDWWSFEQAGRVGTSSGAACNQYELYRDDINLISSLGHNAHRFSLEWSRLEPREGEWDEAAFRHYADMLSDLRQKGIEPVVTLHHFSNPQWFSDRGGWAASGNHRFFSRYARKAVQAFGSQVRFWNTINEPVVYLYHGFCTGLWPPGHKSFSEAAVVFRHLLYAHVDAYHEIHKHYESVLKTPVWVSIAKHMSVFTPCNPMRLRDRWLTFLRDWFFNHLYLQALTTGFLFFPGLFCEFLSAKSTLDFIGLNYYTRHFVTGGGAGPTPLGADCDEKHHEGQSPEVNAMGWEVYPQGFYQVLMSLRKYRLPVIVCENGICANEDEQRQRFIRNHLGAFANAARDGLEVWGFFYWSLLDNFEWADGFKPRFGLVEVDYQSQKRTPRDSAHVLAEICRKWTQSNHRYHS